MTDTAEKIKSLLQELESEDDEPIEPRGQTPPASPEGTEPPQTVEASPDLATVADALARVEKSLNEVKRSRGEGTVELLGPAMMANRGVELRMQGRQAEARPLLQAAAEGGDPMGAGTFGLVLKEEGNREGALHWFRVAAEAGDDQARYNLGHMLADEGKIEEAKTWLKRSRDPWAAELLATLAQ
jgi:tetratricopeptide (TPR) repeat protein